MITNFKFKKHNIWLDMLEVFGYDYKRIMFDYGRDRYIISAWGNVTINGVRDCHVYELPQNLLDEINDELKKLY